MTDKSPGEVAKALHEKLKLLDLTQPEKDLLNAIFKLAHGITESQDGEEVQPAFHSEFASAFEPLPPHKVALLLEYAATPVPAVTGSVVAHLHPSAATGVTPGMVVRSMVVRSSPTSGHSPS